tara:strand:- start:193 stop:351 length:159 start_codon:yes stop_codon:yes gene_type:complete
MDILQIYPVQRLKSCSQKLGLNNEVLSPPVSFFIGFGFNFIDRHIFYYRYDQ